MTATPVHLEVGTKRVFATTVDWPGWCRSGRTEEDALEALAVYFPRYADVAAAAGAPFPPRLAKASAVGSRVRGVGRYAAGAERLAGAVRRQAHRLARAGPRVGDAGPDRVVALARPAPAARTHTPGWSVGREGVPHAVGEQLVAPAAAPLGVV